MKSIRIDLDVISRANSVARATGIPEDTVLAGYLRAVAWCLDTGTARMTGGVDLLRGFWGRWEEHIESAMISFGLLGRDEDGELEVPLAARALKAAAASGRASRRRSKAKPVVSVPTPGVEDGNQFPEPPGTDRNQAPRDTDLLCADFLEITGAKYAWNGGKDGAAFAKIRKTAKGIDEIRDRWRRGLKEPGWTHVSTIAQLWAKWNDLAPGARPLDLRRPMQPGVFTETKDIEL